MEKILKLIEDTFTDREVFEVAMYLVSALAVAKTAHQGVMSGEKEVKGLPPQALELMYRYESALVDNDFFLKNYAVLKSISVLDKIKVAATTELVRVGAQKKEKKALEAAKNLLMTELDSLILLAFIWKGYEFSINFASKLRMLVELDPMHVAFFGDI